MAHILCLEKSRGAWRNLEFLGAGGFAPVKSVLAEFGPSIQIAWAY